MILFLIFTMQTFSIMLNTEKWADGNLLSQNTIYTDLDEERKFYLKKKPIYNLFEISSETNMSSLTEKIK